MKYIAYFGCLKYYRELLRSQKLNDKELLKAARVGDNQAFRNLVKKYESKVAATVIGMLGVCNEAEDVGQETFIRFYKSLKSYRGEASLGTYLTRIAINLSLNEIKRRKRNESHMHKNPENKILEFPDLNNSFKQDEIKDFIQQALGQLDPKFRTILVLRLIDGYSTQETAQILKLPLGTVLSRLARAQQKLKQILRPLLGGIQ
jgi:RNA polymerase sigma-70 factor (ECF subfamily)